MSPPAPLRAATVPVEPDTLASLVNAAADAYPDAAALVAGGRQLSYRQLDQRSDAIAAAVVRALTLASVRGAVVGLLAPRGPDAILGLLGIAKAGASYLPLDPDQPADRIAFMLADSGTALILVGDEDNARPLPAALNASPPALRLADVARGALAPVDKSRPGPRDAAYVIYTSGSTGRPKGVVVEHASAVRLALAHRDLFALQPGDRGLQFASLAFDASVSEIFSAFASGATLVMAGDVERRSPAALVDLLERQEVNVATVPPSLLPHLPRRALPALRTLVVAGEVCAAREMEHWSVGRRLINAYGPTEATVCATASVYRPGDRPTQIGRALPGVSLHVLDESGLPVREGGEGEGELYIGGPGVARGYLNRPGLTAQRFVEGPLFGGRAYRTGDRVRWIEPGVLEFRGRMDDQVKIAGHRIEPDEVARALESLPGIRRAAAIAHDSGMGHRLVAFYVPGDPKPPPESLPDGLARWLPAFMLPAAYVALDVLPLTTNGKIDRAALAAAVPTGEDGAVPSTPTESAMARLWCEVLGLQSVRQTDNFYALGGDSLRLTQLLLRINQTFGTALVASRFRKLANLAELAAYVARQERPSVT